MANFFTLKDGNLSNSSIYGKSVSAGEMMNNSNIIPLISSSLYSPTYVSDGSTISAIAINTAGTQLNTDSTITITGTTAANQNIIIDATNNSVITNSNSAYTVAASPFALSSWSCSFATVGNYVLIPSNSATAFTNNNFTIEFWYYAYLPTENVVRPIYTNYTTFGTNSIYIGKHTNTSGKMAVYIGTINTISPILSDPVAMTSGWNHWAITRNNNTYTLFKNGLSASTYTHGTSISTTPATNVGYIGTAGDSTATTIANGAVSNFRIVNGACLYTTAFTPSATSLTNISNTVLLTLQNSCAKDNSSNKLALTGINYKPVDISPFDVPYSQSTHAGSVFFQLSSNLQIPASTYTDIAANPFTLEFWFKTLTAKRNAVLFSNRNVDGSGLCITANRTIPKYGTGTVASSGIAYDPQFDHYSFGNATTYGYVEIPCGANFNTTTSTSDFCIQLDFYCTSFGLSNVTKVIFGRRVVSSDVDLMLYTSSNTTSLQINVPNESGSGYRVQNFNTGHTISLYTWTSLALVRSGGTIRVYKNGVGGNTLNINPDGGIWDNNGNNIYLFAAYKTAQASHAIGSIRNFNMHWSNVIESKADCDPTNLFSLRGNFTYSSYNGTSENIDNVIDVYNGTTLVHTASNYNHNNFAWHHLALTRDSNGSRLFIDGLQQDATNASQATTNLNSSPNIFSIGKPLITTGTRSGGTYCPYYFDYYDGYISNFRYVAGTSLYTSNFSPSAMPLTNITNTKILLNTNNVGLKSSTTATYPISSFTNYNGSNNLLSPQSQNWQLLKLDTPLTSISSDYINFSLKPSTAGTMSVLGTSITAKDASTNNTSVTYTATVPSLFNSTTKPYSTLDSSMTVDGTAYYLTIPYHPAFNFATNDFTIECWFQYTSVGSNGGGIIGRWGSGSNDFVLYVAPTTKLLTFSVNNATVITGPSVTISTWYHVAVTRSNSLICMYLNGVAVTNSPYIINNTPITCGLYDIYVGKYGAANSGLIGGLINNLRITNGSCIYKTNFTPPSAVLNTDRNTSLLLKNGSDFNKVLISTDNNNFSSFVPFNISNESFTLHIGSALSGTNTEIRTISASTFEASNIFIHNKGYLNFQSNSSTTLGLYGSAGLQITSDGTLNIGSSSVYMPLSSKHKINLYNTQIDVHNGGTLNVYGAPKTISTFLSSDVLSGNTLFTTIDDLSSQWLSGDSLLFTSNTLNKMGFDVLNLSGFTQSNILKTSTSSKYDHFALSSVPHAPSISNLSRNIAIQGFTSANKGTIRANDGANTYINYAQLSNFGINASYKNGIVLGNSSSGNFVLSGSSITQDGLGDSTYFVPVSGRTLINTTIDNNILHKSGNNGLLLDSISTYNVKITNNLILSSVGTGFALKSLSSSDIILSNNTIVGSLSYGSFYQSNNISTDVVSINYNNNLQGIVLSGNNNFKISGKSIYSGQDGVLVNASSSNLSSVIFRNLTASNNNSNGFKIIGNNSNYLTPLVINTNNSEMSNNSGAGIEAYNITGTFSGLTVNNNLNYGIKTSIGNGVTIFDKLTSITPTSNYLVFSVPFTTTGSVLVTAFSPFPPLYNEGSFYFNGIAGMRLSFATSSQILIGAGQDYTMESWVYPLTGGTGGTIFSQYEAWPTALNYYLNYNYTTGIPSFFWRDMANAITSPYALNFNQWNHLAITRTLSTVRMLLNGVMVASSNAAVFNTGITNTTQSTTIGAHRDNTSTMKGYVSCPRLIVGTALYTTNFTPNSAVSAGIYSNQTRFLFNYPYNGTYKSILSSADISTQSLVILSGYNYNKTVIRNSILSASSTNPAASASVALNIDSTKFSEFSLENTTLSAGIPLKITATKNLIEGSYLFNNCIVGNTPLGSGITNIYQSNALRATGFAFTSINKINGNHITYFAAGQRMLDYVTPSVTLSDVPSEKLIPSSKSVKIRSGSKYVALNNSENTLISVYVRKSISDDGSTYNGNNPRLILVRNPSMGVYSDTVIDTLSLTNDVSGSFVQLTGASPYVIDNGVLEYYVDCDGTTGWINIDKWETV